MRGLYLLGFRMSLKWSSFKNNENDDNNNYDSNNNKNDNNDNNDDADGGLGRGVLNRVWDQLR